MSEVLDRRSVRAARGFKVIGHGIPSVDGVENVTVTARYAADHAPTGMLFARVVRGPRVHATIDSAEAEAYPSAAAGLPIAHAIGRPMRVFPATPERVLKAIMA